MMEVACSLIKPDLVLIVPCYVQPIKIKNSATAEQRLEMTRIMFPEKQYLVSDYEIKKGGLSYSIDTLNYLKKTYRDHKIYLLIGEDSYSNFVEWKKFEEILKNYTSLWLPDRVKVLRTNFLSQGIFTL